MIPQVPGIIFVVVLAVVFGWLATRAWHAKNPFVRFPGSLVSGLLTILFAAIGVLGLIGTYQLAAPHNLPPDNITVKPSEARLAQAQKGLVLCAGCHSTTGQAPLDGGSTSLLGPLGDLYAPNLTPGGPIKGWTDAEIARAMREGVDKDGHALLVMPSDAIHNLSDEDTAAVIAVLRAQPPVQHETPPRNLSLVATVLIGAGLFPTAVQPPESGPVVAPPPAVDAANGLYLVNTAGCRTCHGADLAGGSANGGGPPPGPNLTVLVPTWTAQQFVQTIRTGTDPSGHPLNPDNMPWKAYSAAYTDDQLQAIYVYLHGLTPIKK
jgi:mono/diheme cytochrome c family protein